MEEVLQEVLARYAYKVPKELIATQGAEPRESARLLMYDRSAKETRLAQVCDLPRLLPHGAVLVFNETKVIPARIRAESGNRELAITVTNIADGEVQTLSSRRLAEGDRVSALDRTFTVVRREEKFTYYATGMGASEMTSFLFAHGEAPLPPYIKETPLGEAEVKRRYQTVFAKHEGSVAAPTASLHFSDALMQALREVNVQMEFVTLHVGLGTFLPVTEAHLKSGALHEESFFIQPETAERLSHAKRIGKKIIPVGTTSLRTLESAFDAACACIKLAGTTSLFIRPGYTFKMADGLMTNFHVPESSLLMLVDAFLGGGGAWRPLYERAIQERFRLFSFGDAMLIL